MNKYLILLIIIIIIIIIIYHHKFIEPFISNNYMQSNQTSPNSNKCCFVEKKFIFDPTSKNNGKFSYIYKKINNPKYCKNNLYNLKMNKSNLFNEGSILYFDDNNSTNNITWSNEMCDEKKSPLGSCRFANKECIEFITQDSCNKLKMEWSEKTCQEQLSYKFIDKVKFKLPEQKYELIQMFPS